MKGKGLSAYSRMIISSRDLYHGVTPIDSLRLQYDGPTGNLVYRRGVYTNTKEYFTYDTLDRLTEFRRYSANSTPNETVTYADNGNITFKTKIGNYTYSGSRPHAVTQVTNTDSLISTNLQSIDYNAFNKIEQIIEGYYRLNIFYGPDNERWKSIRYNKNTNVVQETRIYAGDYERVTKGTTTTHFYYLGEDVMYARKTTYNSDEGKLYFICKDNVGTIRKIYDGDGTRVFLANYYPWGRQIGGSTNSLNFFRGFGGHEYLSQFKLVNMNGRLYDPLLGRFLSPDNYVQLPDFSQNFNRYSYCINNPLKYTDPDGNFFKLAFVVGFVKGVIRWANNDGDWTSPFVDAWKGVKNVAKISLGLLHFDLSRPMQLISRFTWELPQTAVGYLYSIGRATFDKIDHIRYFDGATYLVRDSKNKRDGVTIGNFININSDKGLPTEETGAFAPYYNPLYMHEYGHYLQSQKMGWEYLINVGVPSLISASKRDSFSFIDSNSIKHKISVHHFQWFERDANIKSYGYFMKEYGLTSWDELNYPLIDYR